MHFNGRKQSGKDKNQIYVFTTGPNLLNQMPLWQIFALKQFTFLFKWSSCFSRNALGVHSECISHDLFFKLIFIFLETISFIFETDLMLVSSGIWYRDERWHYNLPESHWQTDNQILQNSVITPKSVKNCHQMHTVSQNSCSTNSHSDLHFCLLAPKLICRLQWKSGLDYNCSMLVILVYRSNFESISSFDWLSLWRCY